MGATLMGLLLFLCRYMRLLCLDGTDGTATAVVHECQSYMSAMGFTYGSSDLACPPSDADACDASDDGYWRCSSTVAGGIYSCPGGAASMQFCGESSVCSQPRGGVMTTDSNPQARMCKYCPNCGL